MYIWKTDAEKSNRPSPTSATTALLLSRNQRQMHLSAYSSFLNRLNKSFRHASRKEGISSTAETTKPPYVILLNRGFIAASSSFLALLINIPTMIGVRLSALSYKESGLTSAQVADMLGHSDTRMVETVYARTRKESVMKNGSMVEKLNQQYVPDKK